jgi:triosephosphate isomerase
MRKLLIVGNWKMNLNTHEASLLVQRLSDRIKIYRNIEVVLAPSMLTLQPLSRQIDRRKFKLAAQNAYHKDEGAYTGEVSFAMLSGTVSYALVGHSERRQYFNEDLAVVREKVSAAVRNKITPILCVGETQYERSAGETRQVLCDQVTTALSGITSQEIEDVIIAYEPVWAISTFGGKLAKPAEVKQSIDFIRSQIADLYGDKAAESIRILYGGSVDEQIVRGYLEIDGCDGALVGGASINYVKFAGVVEAAYRVLRSEEDKK